MVVAWANIIPVIQVVIRRTSTGSRNILMGFVLLWDLVAHQDAVCSCQVGWVLVVTERLLVLKGGPKSSISASVGTLQRKVQECNHTRGV